MTVTDSNNLTASVTYSYSSFSAAYGGIKVVSTPRLSITSDKCVFDFTVNSYDYINGAGADIDAIWFDRERDDSYELEDSDSISLPYSYNYDYQEDGTYRSKFVLVNDAIDSASPSYKDFYYVEFATTTD